MTQLSPLRARLVGSGEPMVYNDIQETDVRTALTRGLADYMAQIVFNAIGGRQVRFKKVFSTWAEPEDEASYPAAAVYSSAPGTYDASKFTPSPSNRCRLSDGRYLVSPASFVQSLNVELWATDPKERMSLVAGLESAFNPNSFMYGFNLELPYYFNERALYTMTDMAYLDTEQDAMRRYRKAVFTVTGEVPVVSLFTIPTFTVGGNSEIGISPKFRLDEVGPDVVIPGSDANDC